METQKPLEFIFITNNMPKEIDECVRKLEDEPGIENPWALCTHQYQQKEKKRERRKNAFRTKMKVMLK